MFFKKKTSTLFKVQYQFEDEDTIYQTTATSAGLASIEADPLVIIVDVSKV